MRQILNFLYVYGLFSMHARPCAAFYTNAWIVATSRGNAFPNEGLRPRVSTFGYASIEGL